MRLLGRRAGQREQSRTAVSSVKPEPEPEPEHDAWYGPPTATPSAALAALEGPAYPIYHSMPRYNPACQSCQNIVLRDFCGHTASRVEYKSCLSRKDEDASIPGELADRG